jgi:DNA helicase-2/ATP-dependent DNA helicase PcrA
VVFITGLEDGTFPHLRSLGDAKELEEERRLAYVGITRARERLHISRAAVRSAWGAPQYNPPSRFLDEIPERLVEAHEQKRASRGGHLRERRLQQRRLRLARSARCEQGPHRRARLRSRAPAWRSTAQSIGLKVGDDVVHATFGEGVILLISEGTRPRRSSFPGSVIAVAPPGRPSRRSSDG